MFLKLYIFFICINIGATVVNNMSFFDQTVPLQTETMPNIANYTTPNNRTYAVSNATYPINQTSGTLFNWFEESTERIFFLPEVVFNLLSGGFLVNVIGDAATSLGFTWPSGFLAGLHALIGITHLIFIIYIVTGRSASSFTGFTPFIPYIIGGTVAGTTILL